MIDRSCTSRDKQLELYTPRLPTGATATTDDVSKPDEDIKDTVHRTYVCKDDSVVGILLRSRRTVYMTSYVRTLLFVFVVVFDSIHFGSFGEREAAK